MASKTRRAENKPPSPTDHHRTMGFQARRAKTNRHHRRITTVRWASKPVDAENKPPSPTDHHRTMGFQARRAASISHYSTGLEAHRTTVKQKPES